MQPLILLSNDDGVEAEGLHVLRAALAQCGELVVVAPDRERSGAGHAISLAHPLRTHEKDGMIVVDGTPVDCVYLGLLHFCRRTPALVVSGINRGYNLGMDVYYSGTVAAAVEAAIRGVPAMAVSLAATESDFSTAASFAAALARALLSRTIEIPSNTLLNVNVPAGHTVGYRVTRLGRRIYRDRVEERSDPRGRKYFWIGGPDLGHHDVPGSDCEAVTNHLISVSPLGLDWTEASVLERGIEVGESFIRSA